MARKVLFRQTGSADVLQIVNVAENLFEFVAAPHPKGKEFILVYGVLAK
jgi:hypothetical protein